MYTIGSVVGQSVSAVFIVLPPPHCVYCAVASSVSIRLVFCLGLRVEWDGTVVTSNRLLNPL